MVRVPLGPFGGFNLRRDHAAHNRDTVIQFNWQQFVASSALRQRANCKDQFEHHLFLPPLIAIQDLKNNAVVQSKFRRAAELAGWRLQLRELARRICTLGPL
jgi:hypothetical protein